MAMRTGAVVRLVALVGAIALLAAQVDASPADPAAAGRHAATVEADQLLAGVVLPAGVMPVAQEPAGDAHQLAVPIVAAFFAAEIDRHAFWTTSASPDAVITSFRSHLPAGAKLVVSASAGETAGAAYALGIRRRFVIGPEQLIVEAVTLSNGLSGIRVDSQVRYVAPRPASERVPAAARLVQITKADTRDRVLLSLVVTRRPVVRRLARLVDGLPFSGGTLGAAYSCPYSGDPTDTFIFRARPGGPVLAKVRESAYLPADPSPCAMTTLTIRGHKLSPLLDGGTLLEQASKLLHVKLTG